MLAQLVGSQVFHLLLVFARLGSSMMLMPALGEQSISPRIRLLLGLAISLIVMPLVEPTLPDLPADPVTLTIALGSEIGIGLFIGTVARIMFTALSLAGTVIAFQTGLA